MCIHSPVLIFSMLMLLFNLALSFVAEAQTKDFCAKPWATLSDDQKQAIDDITATLIDERGLPNTPIKLWKTRTVPYYVDSSISPDLLLRIKKAAQILADNTLVRLVKCKLDVVNEKTVKGFIYIGSHSDICTTSKPAEASAACSKGLGLVEKSTLSGLPKEEVDHTTEKYAAKVGARIGLNKDNSAMVILHELIHRLGFAHQQQSPYADRYLSAGDKKNEQCLSKTADYRHVYWIPYYDPASVMHYPLEACGKMTLDCETGEPNRGRSELRTCKIDKLIRDRDPCFYAPDSVTGDRCFKRPAAIFKETKYYSASDFGHMTCMSMLDQALILSRYITEKKDTYGIEALIEKGLCEAN